MTNAHLVYVQSNSTDESCGQLFYDNGAEIGHVYQEVDGYWVFQPDPGKGYMNEFLLRVVADKLEEMNKEWHEEIMRTLCTVKPSPQP